MNYGTTCKFCRRPITVEIADDYAELGDPFKLLPLACCNPCGDNRMLRRALERKVQLVARCLELAGPNKTEKLIVNSRNQLTKLTKDYTELIARWNGSREGRWDEACVNSIMDKPEAWGDCLGRLWTMFRQLNLANP